MNEAAAREKEKGSYDGQLVTNCHQLKNVGLAITQPVPNDYQLNPPTTPGNLIPPS
jgi:hypothetical protein